MANETKTSDANMDAKIDEGLRGAIIGRSKICDVNGTDGKLIYAGYDIHDLAQNTTFEEVVFLLWHTRLPNQSELDALKADLDKDRALPDEVLAAIKLYPKTATPMDALRTATSLLSMYDPDEGDDGPEANRRKAVRLTARMGTLVAALARLQDGKGPIAPKPGLSTAANFLYMLHGEEPNETAERTMDVALILHADHELNASTFAARVTIATLTDVYSAITSAIGALAGPLHGGANVNVMHLLEKIGTADKAELVVTQMLAAGQKIPGIGHAVYKALDPRAVSLSEMSEKLADATGDRRWFELSERVQEAADKALAARGKTTLKANVDFFSASVYRSLGIPTEQFTPVFAVARVAGWLAHVLEQLEDNKIMRPRSLYVGPRDLTVTPIAQR